MLDTFVRRRAHVAYNLRMRFARLSESWLVRLVLCSFALALGAATARFTDIARRDLTREPPEPLQLAPAVEARPRAHERTRAVRTSEDLTGAQSLRASVRNTGKPSSSARASRLLRAP
jgi:hypothetical protein